MMDNSQGSNSDEVVSSANSEPVFEAKPESTNVSHNAEVKEEKRVPLHELYKERNRRKAVEEEVNKLKAQVDELSNNYSKVKNSQEDDDLITEAEKELGIDRDAARKLLNLQRKVAEKTAPKQKNEPINDPVLKAMDDFKRRAAESSNDYEDWNDMIPGMQAIMSKEIEQNGLGAYNKSPEYYYSKALKAKANSVEKLKKEIATDKANATESSSVETGSGSSVTKGSSSKITQAVFDANRGSAKWVRENESEIKQLWREGKLK